MPKGKCPLADSDLAAPRLFADDVCVSTAGNTVKVCFFQKTAGKSVAVACLGLEKPVAERLGQMLSDSAQKTRPKGSSPYIR